MKSSMKCLLTAFALVSVAVCNSSISSKGESDLQFVMDKKNPGNALIGVTLCKATNQEPKKSVCALGLKAVVSS